MNVLFDYQDLIGGILALLVGVVVISMNKYLGTSTAKFWKIKKEYIIYYNYSFFIGGILSIIFGIYAIFSYFMIEDNFLFFICILIALYFIIFPQSLINIFQEEQQKFYKYLFRFGGIVFLLFIIIMIMSYINR